MPKPIFSLGHCYALELWKGQGWVMSVNLWNIHEPWPQNAATFLSIIYNFLGHHICFVVHVIEGCAGVLCSCVSKGVLHEPQMFQICALVVWCELTMCTFPVFIVEVWQNKGIAYYILLFVCRWHTTRYPLLEMHYDERHRGKIQEECTQVNLCSFLFLSSY